MSDDALHALGQKYDTDKARPEHAYTDFYSKYLSRYRNQPLHLLEIGVFRGASCRMWEEYFRHPDAVLAAVDVKRRHLRNVPRTPRWRSFLGSQEDRAFLSGVCDQVGPLDVVIEDGRHAPEAQIVCFEALWPHLASGGLYVIEDIHTSYSDEAYYQKHIRSGPRSIMPYLHGLLDELVPAEDPRKSPYAFVHFYAHVVLIGKR